MNHIPTVLYLGEDRGPKHSVTVVTNEKLAAEGGNGWWRATIGNESVTLIKTDAEGEIVDFFAIPFDQADNIHDALTRIL
jgi:hypothetical protein